MTQATAGCGCGFVKQKNLTDGENCWWFASQKEKINKYSITWNKVTVWSAMLFILITNGGWKIWMSVQMFPGLGDGRWSSACWMQQSWQEDCKQLMFMHSRCQHLILELRLAVFASKPSYFYCTFSSLWLYCKQDLKFVHWKESRHIASHRCSLQDTLRSDCKAAQGEISM